MIRALKSCCFAGKNYFAGDAVPESAVDKKSVAVLVKMKIITVTDDKPLEPPQPEIETESLESLEPQELPPDKPKKRRGGQKR